MRTKLFLVILAASLLGACGTQVQNPVSGQQERTVINEAGEIALGRKEHAQVLKEYPVYANPKVQAYVNALGQQLAKQSHRSQLDWHFTVLDSPEINAFALPGGYVYVTRGMLAYLDSEAELAGVIGHEIGHVTARHGAQRATREQDAGLAVLGSVVLGAVLESRGYAGAGQLASEVSQAAAAGYVASYSRDQELQADSLGAEYLARMRYDPANMVDVIRVLKSQEQFAIDEARARGLPAPARNTWLASHPSNDQRLQAISRLAAQYQGQYSDDQRNRYLQAIDGLHFGESTAQGLTRGRNFYHVPLGVAITAPARWTIRNSSEQLSLVNASSTAALVLRLAPPDMGSSHEEVIRKTFKPVRGQFTPVVINGLPATCFSGQRVDANSNLSALEVCAVSGPADHRFLLVWSFRDAAALRGARAALLEAQNSFRPMSAADRAQAVGWVIKTTAYPQGGFVELASRSPLESAQQQLRLINGVYGGADPRPGQLVKVVDRQ